MEKGKALATIWEIPDRLWEQSHPVTVELDPPKATGRKRVDRRRLLDGIVFRMPRSLAGKLLAGFFAIPIRRIPILCGTMAYEIRL